MKKILFLVILFPTLVSGQFIELKLNPLGALFNRPDVSFETGFTDKISLEYVLSARYGPAGTGSSVSVGSFTVSEPKQKGVGLTVIGKYKNPFDFSSSFYQNTYVGVFARYNRYLMYDPDDIYFMDYRRVVASLGLVYGYKFVSSNDWVFDSGIGFGRAFLENNEFINSSGIPSVSFKTGLDFYSRFLIGKRF